MGCNSSIAISKSRRLLKQYKLDPIPIGRGSYGEVYRGVDKENDAVVAIKKISKESTFRYNIDVEIDLLRRFCKHENIVSFIATYESCAEVSLVMEFMPGGQLLKVLESNGAHGEEDAAHYLRAMAAALHYLHGNCVAHRDMKPENLLLTHRHGGDLKLCDFGCAKALESQDELMWCPCGTLAYSAPEVLWLRQASEGSYTLKCDMFSVGVILYYILVGYHPFDVDGGCSSFELQNNMICSKWSFDDEAWWSVSDGARSVVASLLEPEPAKRLTAEQLIAHQWTIGLACSGRLSIDDSRELGSHLKFGASMKGDLQCKSQDSLRPFTASEQLNAIVDQSPASAPVVDGSAEGPESTNGKCNADSHIRKLARPGKKRSAKGKAGKDDKNAGKVDMTSKDKRQYPCHKGIRQPSKERRQLSKEKTMPVNQKIEV